MWQECEDHKRYIEHITHQIDDELGIEAEGRISQCGVRAFHQL